MLTKVEFTDLDKSILAALITIASGEMLYDIADTAKSTLNSITGMENTISSKQVVETLDKFNQIITEV